MRHVNFLEHRIQDLRLAVRQLLKYPGFACTAVLVLALGIAASLTIFAFVDAALIRPLPYEEPSRLLTVFGARPDLASAQTGGDVSYLDFVDWQARNRAFRSIAAFDVRTGFVLTRDAGPERVAGLRVTSGFFRTLGVKPLLGRDFHRDEEGPSAPPTVMLSYSAWQARFGGRPDILGRTVTLQAPWLSDGEPHIVIGVLPAGFQFAMAERAEFWVTIRGAQGCWGVRRCRSMLAIARLADGATAQTAAANMTSVLEQLRNDYPADHRNPEIAKLIPLRDVMLGDVRPILLMLLGAAGLLLVIACINVMSLLLARTDTRTHEISVRNALGASSARLVLQFATEALALSAIATALGLMLASFGIRFLLRLVPVDVISRMPSVEGIGMNVRLLAFACAVSGIAALVFALTPLLRISFSRRLVGLDDGTRGSGGRRWRRLGARLVVAELAVAVLLLVSAGLFGKSLHRLLHVDLGFNARGLIAVPVIPMSLRTGAMGGAVSTNEEHPGALARRVAERLAALPAVRSVGYVDLLPVGPGLAPASMFWILGRAEDQQLKETWPVRRVSAHYFSTLQATLLRGRSFTEEEVASARPVMLVNETAARQYFAGEDPIGRSIAFGGPRSPAREIVGIVADIKDGPPETAAHPSAYVPFDEAAFNIVIRSSQGEASLFPSIIAAIREIQPDALVGEPTTMPERINGLPSTSLHRSSAWLVGAFAVMALVLSVVGLYGVVAYTVGQRAREIGVRMALGAQRRSVYRLVLGESAWWIGTGTALGVITAATAAPLLRPLLFGVPSWGPPTGAAAAAILTISALLASYVPARRAASVNPIEVLRAE